MTRLAGMTVYALIAALVLVAPLSAQEEPPPETAVPHSVAPESSPPEVAPPQAESAPEEAAAPESAPAEPAPPGTASAPPAEPAPAAAPAAQPEAARAPAAPAERRSRRSRDRSAPRATAAADTTVTISDFQFAPSSVTVDVGDTVTWRNEGPTAHSATSENGSFDTGIYGAGQSRSHTFDQAGTFNYFCTPHPNMRGSVTVRAASTGGGTGGSGADDGGGTGGETGAAEGDAAAQDDGSGAALPATGLDAGGLAVLGLATLGLGAWLRRRAGTAG